jgi:hypothetical protein
MVPSKVMLRKVPMNKSKKQAKYTRGSTAPSSSARRLPRTGDDVYEEILESCRHFYAFQHPTCEALPTKILPRLEDSLVMMEQKEKVHVSRQLQRMPDGVEYNLFVGYHGNTTIPSPMYLDLGFHLQHGTGHTSTS